MCYLINAKWSSMMFMMLYLVRTKPHLCVVLYDKRWNTDDKYYLLETSKKHSEK